VRVGKGVGGLEPIGNGLREGNAGTLIPKNKLRPRKPWADAIDKHVSKTDFILVLLFQIKFKYVVNFFIIVETS
jgi:hypothetical protein